jgi:hypothetical protein
MNSHESIEEEKIYCSTLTLTSTFEEGGCLSLRQASFYPGMTRYHLYSVFNLKLDRQLRREYFTSDAIYNGSAGMTLYYYMCRSWQDCCRRGENRSWPSVSVESVNSECWYLNNAFFTLLYCG